MPGRSYETSRMKLLLARLARQFRQLVNTGVQDCETNVTLLDPVEFLIQTRVPKRQPVPNPSVLENYAVTYITTYRFLT